MRISTMMFSLTCLLFSACLKQENPSSSTTTAAPSPVQEVAQEQVSEPAVSPTTEGQQEGVITDETTEGQQEGVITDETTEGQQEGVITDETTVEPTDVPPASTELQLPPFAQQVQDNLWTGFWIPTAATAIGGLTAFVCASVAQIPSVVKNGLDTEISPSAKLSALACFVTASTLSNAMITTKRSRKEFQKMMVRQK